MIGIEGHGSKKTSYERTINNDSSCGHISQPKYTCWNADNDLAANVSLYNYDSRAQPGASAVSILDRCKEK